MEEYRPLIALNVYLNQDFRREILSTVVESRSILSDRQRRQLLEAIKENVRISGFRNPIMAPETLLVRNMIAPFEQDSRFVKVILEAWALINDSLQPAIIETIKSFPFKENDQKPSYPNPDNAFLVGWPEGLTYEMLAEEVNKRVDGKHGSLDEIALLTIWISGCLPTPLSASKME